MRYPRQDEGRKTENKTLNGIKGASCTERNIKTMGDLKVLHTNADGLVNKRYDLKTLLQSLTEKPDIIAVTEIKPRKLVISYKLVSLIWRGIMSFVMD